MLREPKVSQRGKRSEQFYSSATVLLAVCVVCAASAVESCVIGSCALGLRSFDLGAVCVGDTGFVGSCSSCSCDGVELASNNV